MRGHGALAQAVLGVSTVVSGLGIAYTSPASLSLTVGQGVITLMSTVDTTSFSSLPIDTRPVLKIGENISTSLTFTAPTTSGQQQAYLIYAQLQEVDGTPVVLPYYNAANPTVQFQGANGSGLTNNTTRAQTCVITTVADTSATSGSQTTPATPVGCTPLYVVTLAFGQTAITAANVTVATGAPFVLYTLPQLGVVPAQIAALQAASAGSQSALGYVPVNNAGDVSGNASFPGSSVVVTIGANGAGSIKAATATLATVNSTTLAATTANIGTSNTTVQANCSNALGNFSATGLASQLHLSSTSGGTVCIDFESAGKYATKLGIDSAGVMHIGQGWSDSTSTARLTLDTAGNAAFRGAVSAPGLSSSTSIVSQQALLSLGNFYARPNAANGDRDLVFQDSSGNNTGFVFQQGSTNYLYFSANGNQQNNMSLSPAGVLTLMQANTSGAVNVGTTLGVTGQATFNGGSSTVPAIVCNNYLQANGVQITGQNLTIGGAAGSAGQMVWNAANSNALRLYSATSYLSIDTQGGVFSYDGPNNTYQTLTSGTASDMSLKENVEPHKSSLATLMQLRVIDFDYTEESGRKAMGRRIGFDAAQVAELIPQAHLDLNGSHQVLENHMVPDTIRSIQELGDWCNGLERRLKAETDRNDALEARLAALEAKLAT